MKQKWKYLFSYFFARGVLRAMLIISFVSGKFVFLRAKRERTSLSVVITWNVLQVSRIRYSHGTDVTFDQDGHEHLVDAYVVPISTTATRDFVSRAE